MPETRCQEAERTGLPPSTPPQPGNDGPIDLACALAIVAHDLRGPLCNVGLILDRLLILDDRAGTERVEPLIARGHLILDELDGVLSGLLERVRTNGAVLGYQPRVIDVRQAVRQAIEINRPLADSRGVAFICDGTSPVQIVGDRQLLLQAVENVVSNAVKYTRTGTSVTIRTGSQDGRCIVSVADQGQGFASRRTGQITRPPLRVPGSARMPHSTGLGLWVAKLIVVRHGGTLEIAARDEDSGSCVTISLPEQSSGRPVASSNV